MSLINTEDIGTRGARNGPRNGAKDEIGPIGSDFSILTFLDMLGCDRSSPERLIESLPFAAGDTTAGTETELQTVVVGSSDSVDLPRYILESNYFANIKKRQAAGETPANKVFGLENFIQSNREGIWDNSWVRFPRSFLAKGANALLEYDLLADKQDPLSGQRKDSSKFIIYESGEEFVRVPVSYLLKLALSDAISVYARSIDTPVDADIVAKTGKRLLGHFISDNTSPETHSFYITPLMPAYGGGSAIAAETSKRFLFTHLLSSYANEKFGLKVGGQRVIVFNSPHPPVRLKHLNEYISDSFYRELFANPCLSGWNDGEKKHAYMKLCHEVLSRSQLNTIAKLKDSGIITNNLVVLPNISNVCLSNNGTHLSIGSLKISNALNANGLRPNAFKSGIPGFTAAHGFTADHEKYAGDLAIKVFEHFLPLFIGTYSAAPYRLEFSDFHPEKILGFLPHELHYTHIRMIWRRWKKKARFKIFNKPVTPFGPDFIDKTISRLFNFKGDYVGDYRLINYLVAVLCTESSPSLDGRPGNEQRLKRDLMHMGVFDERMSLYLFYRMRKYSEMGYSGFEGRYYSLFDSISSDLAKSADLQALITLYAYSAMASGEVSHAHIPDTPFVESERRQITFGTAIGIPTFYVRKNTTNQFIRKILSKVKRIRSSARYPGYFRVLNTEYLKGLVRLLEEEAAPLIEMLGLRKTLADLKLRIEFPGQHAAASRITSGILKEAGVSSPFKLSGDRFNEAAEKYYRSTLRLNHLKEAFDLLKGSIDGAEEHLSEYMPERSRRALKTITGNKTLRAFLDCVEDGLLQETLSPEDIQKLICIMLIDVHAQSRRFDSIINRNNDLY
ncbi:MAG: hypothetical protein HQK89_15275 [Nitrospirae bacterium]|nr:hypothetical protein [Nitrospirota bacterium]